MCTACNPSDRLSRCRYGELQTAHRYERLFCAMRKRPGPIALWEICRAVNGSKKTVREDIGRLKKARLVAQHGTCRWTRYYITADWSTLLDKLSPPQ